MTEKERIQMLEFYLAEIEESMRENDFQRDFFESLNEQYMANGDLSEKQFECIRRMYERVTA